MPQYMPCAVCAKPMALGGGSLRDGTGICHPCRKAKPSEKRDKDCVDCGALFTAMRGLRCNPCRHVRAKANATSVCSDCDRPAIATGLCSNHYSQKQREKHGRVYPDGKKKLQPRTCGICSDPVTRVFGDSKVAIHKKCREEFPGRAARIQSGKVSLARKVAEARVAKAAAGTSGGNRVYVAGDCTWCGEYAVRLGKYCSDKCKTSATFKKRSSGKTFKISPKKRAEIYERDGWTCQLCAYPVNRNEHYLSDYGASLDHIIPQAFQIVPDHSPSNLRLVHRWCNSSRGDGSNMTDEEFQSRVLVKFSEMSLAA